MKVVWNFAATINLSGNTLNYYTSDDDAEEQIDLENQQNWVLDHYHFPLQYFPKVDQKGEAMKTIKLKGFT